MFYNGMDGGENDLAISEVPVQRERRNRTNGVTCSKVSNIFAHGIDNTGSLVSQACREFYRFDIFVVAPHCLGAVDADGFDLDTNFVRAGSGNLRFDEFEDFRLSGLCEFDRAGHKASVKSGWDVGFQAGNKSPNMGRPLCDSSRVASSCSTSQCSARRRSAMRTMSTAVEFRGRPVPEKRPWTITNSPSATIGPAS